MGASYKDDYLVNEWMEPDRKWKYRQKNVGTAD